MESIDLIAEFFAYTNLPDAKERLRELLDVTVTGSFNKELSCRERCNLVYFTRQLESLIGAAHVVYLSGKTPD